MKRCLCLINIRDELEFVYFICTLCTIKYTPLYFICEKKLPLSFNFGHNVNFFLQRKENFSKESFERKNSPEKERTMVLI